LALSGKDMLGLKETSVEEIELILDTAEPCKDIFKRDIKKVPTLRGKTMVNLFYEPSTRTRTSFEIAGKWMSADVVNIQINTSSVVKGESLEDTAETLEALGADLVVVRHSVSGVPHLLAGLLDAAVINAGDGANEHPTQALLDFYTIREKKKKFEGLKVAIVGDILHSRVARSNIWGLTKLGAEVIVVGPPTLIPLDIEKMNVKVSYDFDEVIGEVDVINMLRIQRERQRAGLFPTLKEYSILYGLNGKRLKKVRKDAIIMHPGPMNIGVEISREVAMDPRACVTEQVTNGVAVRMALLYLLLRGGAKDAIVD
jgi:aspartate carbamoyltransferase catalytic subunit